MAVFRHSRLEGSNIMSDKLGTLYIEPKINFIERDPRDKLYRMKEGDRLDLLAQSNYGETQLRHVILRANPRYMSEFDIKTGDVIVIPSPERSELFE